MRDTRFARPVVGIAVSLIVAVAVSRAAHARPTTQTTAFTYQGLIKNGGSLVNGTVDLQFTLFDAAAAGVPIGSTLAVNAVALADGVFTTTLDFGALAFNGQERWLEIGINGAPNGGAGPYTTLTPRQKLAATPYAAFALNALLPSTYPNAVNFNNAGNAFTGTHSGNGAGLTNLNPTSLAPGTAGINISGNAATATTATTAGNVSGIVALTNGGTGASSAATALANLGAAAASHSHALSSLSGLLAAAQLPSGGAWPLSSDLNIDANTLLVSAAGNRIGVGTASPNAKLHVLSSATGTPVVVFNAPLMLESTSDSWISMVTDAADLSGIAFGRPGSTGAELFHGAIAYNDALVGGMEFRTGGNVTRAVIDSAGNMGVGTTAPTAKLHSTSADIAIYGATSGATAGNLSRGVFGEATSATGANFGVWGESDSTSGRGVFGVATAVTGSTYGGKFENNSTTGMGLVATAYATTGATYGVRGETVSTSGIGTYGLATATAGLTYGVYGESASNGGRGLFAAAFATSGSTRGGKFENYSTSGVGIQAVTFATSGVNWGIDGISNSTSGTGVLGEAEALTGNTVGVVGRADSVTGIGVEGVATATSGLNYGGYFETASPDGRGVYSEALATTGSAYGGRFLSSSPTGYGLVGRTLATTGDNNGVLGQSDSTAGTGVQGYASATTGAAYGVYGISDSASGIGVYGVCVDNIAVQGIASGTTGTNFAGRFISSSTSGYGVYARATAASGTTYGVWGQASTAGAGYGVYADGDMGCSGFKTFRIDHPDDPANKYLLHYAAESPEVINFYSGKVTLNGAGEAVVDLPLYFAKINKDPRYTLTAIGAAMPNLHVAEEIDENSLALGAGAEPGAIAPPCWFRIAGGTPGMKVSWEVKAVRNDRYVQQRGAPIEIAKKDLERGTYQHPELYGQPADKALGYMEAHVARAHTGETEGPAARVRSASNDGPAFEPESPALKDGHAAIRDTPR